MKDRSFDSGDDWATPRDLYEVWNQEFAFDFDPCPLKADFDGLSLSWGGRNFVNPPYSQKLKEAFIRKAVEEQANGKLSVLLLPVSTSTAIFHDLIYGKAEIRFLRKRVKFEGVNTKGERVTTKCGMHDSMLVIFRPKEVRE